MRGTWASVEHPQVDVRFVYGNPGGDEARAVLERAIGAPPPEVPPGELVRIGDVLIAGCADSFHDQEDCLAAITRVGSGD